LQTDQSHGESPSDERIGVAAQPRHLVAVPSPPVPQRRSMPRRQAVAAFPYERRQGDRRRRQPGLDGLLRTVLSDVWR
jgi:hypothetical protein